MHHVLIVSNNTETHLQFYIRFRRKFGAAALPAGAVATLLRQSVQTKTEESALKALHRHLLTVLYAAGSLTMPRHSPFTRCVWTTRTRSMARPIVFR